jgi:hypothetical protein
MILFKISTSNNQPMSTRQPMRITAAPATREKDREPVKVRGRVGVLMAELGKKHGRSAPESWKTGGPDPSTERHYPELDRPAPDLAQVDRTEDLATADSHRTEFRPLKGTRQAPRPGLKPGTPRQDRGVIVLFTNNAATGQPVRATSSPGHRWQNPQR